VQHLDKNPTNNTRLQGREMLALWNRRPSAIDGKKNREADARPQLENHEQGAAGEVSG
jgi:hypothetical protein